jgi:hypothetical protein
VGNGGVGDGVVKTVGVATVGVACGDGRARLIAPVATNDARPTTTTTAPSESSVLYRLMPPLIIERGSAKGGPANRPNPSTCAAAL